MNIIFSKVKDFTNFNKLDIAIKDRIYFFFSFLIPASIIGFSLLLTYILSKNPSYYLYTIGMYLFSNSIFLMGFILLIAFACNKILKDFSKQ